MKKKLSGTKEVSRGWYEHFSSREDTVNDGGGGGRLCEILAKWGVGVYPDRGVNPRGYGTLFSKLASPLCLSPRATYDDLVELDYNFIASYLQSSLPTLPPVTSQDVLAAVQALNLNKAPDILRDLQLNIFVTQEPIS